MTGTDPFAHDDAAYVLGALDAADRRAFEDHLRTCAACRARMAELRGTAALLATLPRSADPATPADDLPAGPVPDTLLPGLLRRARKERRRRQLVTSSVGIVAAACLVALAVVLWPAGSNTPSGPAPRTMSSLQPNPLKVTAQLTAQQWGTKIEVHCSYPSYDHKRFSYTLVVIDKRNEMHEAGDWTLVPGKNGIEFTTGTAVPPADIDRVQVRTPSGTPLLELKL